MNPQLDPSRDLAFYCHPTNERWSHSTAATRGIGGSEEAVLWLSKLLHQRGWNVTVYGDCGDQDQLIDGVLWKPHWSWNRHHPRAVTILWRHAQFAEYPINSAKVILDLHDAIPESDLTPDRLARITSIFAKSHFHRSLFPTVPDEKFTILPNGIDSALFNHPATRDTLLLINTSSAERSLPAFLDCFAQIKLHVLNAKAAWAYGWDVFDFCYTVDHQKVQWKAALQQRMRALGVQELGRLSHAAIADLYLRANLFLYPTEFAEIDCISLSKAMAAGAMPITTNFGALAEKLDHGGVSIPSPKTAANWIQPHQFHFEITDPIQQALFVQAAIHLLHSPPSEAAREPMRAWARRTYDWNAIADAWHNILSSDEVGAPDSTVSPSTLGIQQPTDPTTLLQQAMALHRDGHVAQAEPLYHQVLHAEPGNATALYLLSLIAIQSGNSAHALQLTDQTLLAAPSYAEAHANRGNALLGLRRYPEALTSFNTAVQLKPELVEAHINLGFVLIELQQFEPALEALNRAVELSPNYAEAHANRGNALIRLQQYHAAIASFDRAIELNPHLAEAHCNRGTALKELQLYPDAIVSFDRAIQLKPGLVDSHSNRAAALQELALYPEALASYHTALRINPDMPYLAGMVVHLQRSLCDWTNLNVLTAQLEARIQRGERVAAPFAELANTGSLTLQQQAAAIYTRDKFPSPSPPIPPHPAHTRIRIGYFSADLHNHATSYLMAQVFELHDRSQFEIYAFSYGPDRHDEMRHRVAAGVNNPEADADHFHDVRTLTDREIADLSRSLQIDIAIDLKGYTRDARTGIFAHRAAPLQASYLGYPGTMAAPFIDYLIADSTVIPESDHPFYSEKIITLPHSYQPNDTTRTIAPTAPTRAEHGLPEPSAGEPDPFVFCCFNVNWKITPATFDLWMRLLAQLPGSVLWLIEDNPWVAANLRKEAASRNIDPARLIFAPHVPLADHLARHQLADLFLDTLPYNAHTTASDALWAGLPVLTCQGEAFAGRVAASLLRAIDLPELITNTPAEYEALALYLARNSASLQALRTQLVRNRLTTPLFDAPAFTRHLESAYTAMQSRHTAALPPTPITIAPISLSS